MISSVMNPQVLPGRLARLASENAKNHLKTFDVQLEGSLKKKLLQSQEIRATYEPAALTRFSLTEMPHRDDRWTVLVTWPSCMIQK